jgi:hypothetical protein
MGFMVDKVAVGQVCVEYFCFYPVSIIPPMLLTRTTTDTILYNLGILLRI